MILNAGSPRQSERSFTRSDATPTSSANVGMLKSGVGLYPGMLRWNARVSCARVATLPSRMLDRRVREGPAHGTTCPPAIVTAAWQASG